MQGNKVESAIYISIIIPIYNEEQNIKPLYEKIEETMREMGKSYEIIFIDDGSIDGSWDILKNLAKEKPEIKAIQLRKNFGQTAALSAGFNYAKGEIIITIDGDMQNDPKDIPILVEKIEQGYDLVSGWRKKRKDPFFRRILPSIIANKLISLITKVKLHDHGCSLKAYRRDLIRNIPLYGEMHRFIAVLAHWVGAKIAEVEVSHCPRIYGKSKYGISRTSGVILDLITVKFLLSYSTSPIRIFGKWGLYSIILGIISGIVTVLMRILEIRTMTRNPLLTLTAILIIVGFQFIVLGLLAEINIRTYFESQNKPIYTVRQIIE